LGRSKIARFGGPNAADDFDQTLNVVPMRVRDEKMHGANFGFHQLKPEVADFRAVFFDAVSDNPFDGKELKCHWSLPATTT
jgi:hypothetical protein